MKKMFLATSCVAFTLVVLSCQKEEIEPNVSNPPTSSSAIETGSKYGTNSSSTDKAKRRKWFDRGGKDYGCGGPGGNCLPTVVVKPHLVADIRGIGDLILHGNATQIEQEFINKRPILEEYVNDEHINGVINGSFRASVRGVDQESMYIIFENKGNGEVLAVYPLL